MGAGGMPMPMPAALGPDMGKYKTPMILGIVGGVLALVGTFLPWINVCAGALGINLCLPFSGIGISGAAAQLGATAGVPALVGFAPLLVLVFGLVGLVMMLLKKPMMCMLALVMGLLVVVLALLWYMQASPLFVTMNVGEVSESIGAGFGVWLSLIGGLLLLVGGLMGMKALKGMPAPAPPMAPGMG
jgi:hypothetical protein